MAKTPSTYSAGWTLFWIGISLLVVAALFLAANDKGVAVGGLPFMLGGLPLVALGAGGILYGAAKHDFPDLPP